MKGIKKGEIYYADLAPVQGSEQGGFRPVLVIQNDIGNKYSSTTIVCVLTSRKRKTDLPTHVFLGKRFGLLKETFALLEQIRTIDKERLCQKVGEVTDHETMSRIEEAIHISFGLHGDAV